MRRILPALALWLACSLAHAQIDLPARVDVGAKLVATCVTPVPEGGKLQILWDFPEGVEFEQIGNRVFLWAPAGSYTLDAVIIPTRTVTVGDQTFDVIAGAIQRSRATVVVGTPEPPPPPPPPPPDPTQAPFPSPGLAVVILREGQETGLLPPSQSAIFTSSKVLQWLAGNTVRLGDGAGFRVWDDDLKQADLRFSDPIMAAAYPLVKEQSNGRLPWIAISTGKGGFSGPLPATVDETLALLKKYGGG